MSHFNLSMPAEVRLRPWVRAESLPWPDLFWAPVSAFPVREMERQWLGSFLTALCVHLSGQGLSPCCFLQASCIQGPLQEAFLADAGAMTPLPGYCRRLWEDPPGPPPPEEIDAIRAGPASLFPGAFSRGLAFWMDPGDFLFLPALLRTRRAGAPVRRAGRAAGSSGRFSRRDLPEPVPRPARAGEGYPERIPAGAAAE